MMSHLNNEMRITKIDDLHDLTIPRGYQNTDVGLIPLDWAVVDMEQIASIIDPQPDHRTPPESSNGEPYIGISDFLNSVKVDWDSSRKIIRAAVDKQQARFQIDKGDIVFGKIGTIGVPKFVPEVSFRFALSANVILLKPKIEPNFLMAFFYSDLFNRVLKSELHSTSQAAFGINKMRFIKVPLPNKQEQTAIANALSDVDALILELEKLIAKKQAIKTATMQQLLTGRTRLPAFAYEKSAHHPDGRKKGYKPSELGEIPEDWEVKTIFELGRVSTGGTPSTSSAEYWNGDVPWITPTDISHSKNIYSSERKISQKGLQSIRPLPANTVLVTCIASIGKNAILRRDGACNQQINAVIPYDHIDVDFLFYAIELSSNRLKASAGITATLIVSKALFEEFQLVIPANLEEQEAISVILNEMDEDIQSLEKRLNKTRQIKQGMMQELLTGKTRLVKPAGTA
ncbi:restriction endonuclease subunit S [Shewanella sp. SM72]|uniref:restriction endonuclease subunit S n=1 Tax=Shewanella sp. SM72 TaxID=2912805 RepID=UPI0021DA9D42|nr:restriction endonuclease subunit S [Shewanella sp. SM72]MCU8019896.1 restriction endonuclease subunit S [Shewanella sp. SM72]